MRETTSGIPQTEHTDRSYRALSPGVLLLLATVGLSLFQASTWVSFVSIHTVSAYPAYVFPFEPFILSLAGQAIGLILALSGRIRLLALPLFSRPATILLFCVLNGLGGIIGFSTTSHIAMQIGSFVGGFAAVPLLFAWGVFLSNQQPRFSALVLAASFLFGSLISYVIEPAGAIGIQIAIAALPLCSALIWLLAIRLGNQEKGWVGLIRENFSDTVEDRAARPSFVRSIALLMGHNRSLPIFTLCAFIIYLMEQFLFTGENNPPGYKLATLGAGLTLVMILILYSGLGKRKDPDTLWPLFVFLIFAALLTIPFLWKDNPVVAANISIIASRSLSIFTWIVLIATISRYSLEPFRAFGIGMLVVSQLPWFLAFVASMLANSLMPQISESFGTIALLLAIVLMGGITVQTMFLYAHSQKAERALPVVDGQEAIDVGRSSFQHALDSLAQDYHLTEREAEVVGLMLSGRTLPEIAEQFVLSINTVRTHYGHAYQKFAIHKKREMFDLFETYLHQTGKL
jgi:DNA-binding CsgD family transcriptional regulator